MTPLGTLLGAVACAGIDQSTVERIPLDGSMFWMYSAPPLDRIGAGGSTSFVPAVLSTADSGSCGFVANSDSAKTLQNHFITGRTRDGGEASIAFFTDSLGNLIEVAEFRSSLPFFKPTRGADSAQAVRASRENLRRASFTSIRLDLERDHGFAFNIVGGEFSKALQGTIAQLESLPAFQHSVERARRLLVVCQAQNPKAVRDAMMAESDSIRKQFAKPARPPQSP